tara:strand:- start:1360 stop:2154 length:795 start_codon:yes stop_codon:yes gene_type:complete
MMARGLCHNCYRDEDIRFQYPKLDTRTVIEFRQCTVIEDDERCLNEVKNPMLEYDCGALCEKHYNRWYKHGDVLENARHPKRKKRGVKPCVIVEFGERCTELIIVGDLCRKHYRRSWQYGDPLYRTNLRGIPFDKRCELWFTLSNKYVTENDHGCWIWNGPLDANGYGKATVTKESALGIKPGVRGMHRISYAYHYGPFDQIFRVHHECNERSCCNPEHLSLVTAAENTAAAVLLRREANDAEVIVLKKEIKELKKVIAILKAA